MGEEKKNKASKKYGFKLPLVFYDLVFFIGVIALLFGLNGLSSNLSFKGALIQSALAFICVFGARFGCRVYKQVWRYGGIECYIRLLAADALGGFAYFLIERFLPIEHIRFAKLLALCCLNCLCVLAIRMVYRYAYKCGSQDNWKGKILRWMLRFFSGGRVQTEPDANNQRIRVAIIGAGSIGVRLADGLLSNPKSQYLPLCFVDIDEDKIGRDIQGLDILKEDEAALDKLRRHQIQEVVFAIPNMDSARRLELYDFYTKAGFRVKVYDYPTMNTPDAKREVREFHIEDLLMRKQKNIINDRTRNYYRDKTVLITGGGGSIGSELCRQLAKMQPKRLVVLDIYENGAYDLQQDLLMAYRDKLDIAVEIASITDKQALERCFIKHKPDICINAAAHKHVPLMETNCIEAVRNNIFGCLNVIQCCEEFGCGRFIMVSTDKAVNPTNVMGATKRVCEMIMQAYSTRGKVKCSATRFGNVLGSAGSVIPLFRRQIALGGPATVTDKRVIRYFMTIPEASQLVLTSGAMAKNGELFVLDMGKPVKIYDLAEHMIRMSGRTDVEIIETGLRPGEKLYEEMLVKRDTLKKTDNEQIFIEQETPCTVEELEQKLTVLTTACEQADDNGMREALRSVVPTFKRPGEVNGAASSIA